MWDSLSASIHCGKEELRLAIASWKHSEKKLI